MESKVLTIDKDGSILLNEEMKEKLGVGEGDYVLIETTVCLESNGEFPGLIMQKYHTEEQTNART